MLSHDRLDRLPHGDGLQSPPGQGEVGHARRVARPPRKPLQDLPATKGIVMPSIAAVLKPTATAQAPLSSHTAPPVNAAAPPLPPGMQPLVKAQDLYTSAMKALVPADRSRFSYPSVANMQKAVEDAASAVKILEPLTATGDLWSIRNAKASVGAAQEGLAALDKNLGVLVRGHEIKVTDDYFAKNAAAATKHFDEARNALWWE